MSEMPLKCVLENDRVVISFGLDTLKFATEYCPNFDDGEIIVVDTNLFAKEVVLALNEEEEDGSTCISRMLDGAILAAIENGAEGVQLTSENEEGDDE